MATVGFREDQKVNIWFSVLWWALAWGRELLKWLFVKSQPALVLTRVKTQNDVGNRTLLLSTSWLSIFLWADSSIRLCVRRWLQSPHSQQKQWVSSSDSQRNSLLHAIGSKWDTYLSPNNLWSQSMMKQCLRLVVCPSSWDPPKAHGCGGEERMSNL